MNRKDLIKKIADKEGVSQKTVSTILKTFGEEIATVLKTGEKVDIFELGSFSKTERVARVRRNPKTGDKIQCSGYSTVKFKVHKTLKDFLNS